MKDIFHHSDQQLSAIGCAIWHSKSPLFLKRRAINQDGCSISPWRRVSLLNNCLSSRHNVPPLLISKSTLFSLSSSWEKLLWLQILSNLRGNKINLLFRHSACLFAFQGPVLQRRIAPALHMLSFLSLLNSRKHLWNIYPLLASLFMNVKAAEERRERSWLSSGRD